jgi:membrane fusion protein, multidrug efflux system
MIMISIMGCGKKESQAGKPGEKAIHVVTTEVKKEKVVSALRYSGTIEALQTIPLSFQSTGTVQSVLVDEGDEVRKGQLLATTDNTDSKNMYQIASSKYQQAKDAYDRLKTVYEKGSLAEVKWVEMETNLEQAKSSMEIAKSNLEKCNLYSPVSGVVGRRNIEPGMSALSIGTAPLEIVDIRQVFVKISVPENELSRVNKGMDAHFTVSALNDKEYVGKVKNISPVADKISRTYDLKIESQNPDRELKPGMVCDVKMTSGSEKESVLIPYQCILRESDNKLYVFVLDPVRKRVTKQQVSVGQYVGSDLEVLSGLSAGQIVVKEGKEKLTDNSLISL